MEAVCLAKVDNPKLHINSVAAVTRATRSKDGTVQHFVFVGTQDGCITQYAVSMAPLRPAGGSSFMADENGEITGKQAQKRSLELGKAEVKVLHVDISLKEPRLISLCDGRINMHHIETLDKIPVFNNTKMLEGASNCCVAVGASAPRLAAVVKKHIVCVQYSESACSPFVANDGQHLPVEEEILQMAWSVNSLIVATKREYSIYDVQTHQLIDQVLVEKTQSGPTLRYINSSGIVGCRIGNVFSMFNGAKKASLDACPKLTFPETTTTLAFIEPFYSALGSTGAVHMHSNVDDEPLPVLPPIVQGSFVCDACLPPVLYACTQRELYALRQRPTLKQVERFITTGKLERAVSHFMLWEGPEDQFVSKLKKVNFACALEAFAARKDEDAFHYFRESGCSAPDVLALFSELRRPGAPVSTRFEAKPILDRRSAAEASATPPRAGTQAGPATFDLLHEFLMEKREPEAARADDADQEAIDFALFMLFREGKVSDVTPELLTKFFLPHNRLKFDECQPLLSDASNTRNQQLLPLLLTSNGKFREALEFCRANELVEEAIVPLRLSEDHEMIGTHLPWMIVLDPHRAIGAVTVPTKCPASPELVLSIISGCSADVMREYLSFSIRHLKSKDEEVHTTHALNLIKMVLTLLAFSGASDPMLNPSAGREALTLGRLRKELLKHLATSTYYNGDLVLAHLENTQLHEEKAMVHSRNKNHAAALEIYVYKLNNVAAAEDYCIKYYDAALAELQKEREREYRSGVSSTGFGRRSYTHKPQEENDVGNRFNEMFTVLLSVLLNPPTGRASRLVDALHLLDSQSRVINPMSVMESLPDDLPLANVAPYLRRMFQTLGHQRDMSEVVSNAANAQSYFYERRKMTFEQRFVLLDEERECVVCHKKIGDSVFGVFPNLKVAHFRCFKEKDRDPVRGVPFREE